jgi:hypothetical protein
METLWTVGKGAPCIFFSLHFGISCTSPFLPVCKSVFSLLMNFAQKSPTILAPMSVEKPSRMCGSTGSSLLSESSRKQSGKAGTRRTSRSTPFGVRVKALIEPSKLPHIRASHSSLRLHTSRVMFVDLLLISAAEIAKCYGTNCTKSGLENHFKRDVRPNVNAIRGALARGDDPKDLTMMENVRDGKIGKGQRTHHVTSYTRCTFSLS